LLQSGHVKWYTPHFFKFVSIITILMLRQILPIMFCVVKEILRLEFLKSLVMNFVSLPVYVNLVHLVYSEWFPLSNLVSFSTGVSLFKSEL
jgi:hypothetical protein